MKNMSFDLVRVTEAAAISASAWVGSGNKLEADRAATTAMQERLGRITNFCGHIKIGEGKKDQSYGLFKGDVISAPHYDRCLEEYDIAVDPIDGTTPTVNSGPEAMSVIAISNKDTMFDTEEHYMLKLAVSGKVAKKTNLYLTTPLPILCQQVATALNKPLHRLLVCILNRPRHQQYIDEMRELGVRIKLIQDCDISAAIATCLPDGEIDMQFGVGGAPEAVITAAAMKCLGGFFMGAIWKDGKVDGGMMVIEDLVKGECAFAATGITNGSLLKGVRFDSRGPITNSVFMRSESGTIRWLTTNHGN
jgi:fructose-1,6-bisphosphatase II